MNIYDAIFLLFPIVAIIAKEMLKLKISLWIIFVVWVGFGWLLVNLATWRHYEMLDELMRNTPNPSEELVERWQNDDASQVFALYFGWAYAAIYFLLCLPLVYIVRYAKKRVVNIAVV